MLSVSIIGETKATEQSTYLRMPHLLPQFHYVGYLFGLTQHFVAALLTVLHHGVVVTGMAKVFFVTLQDALSRREVMHHVRLEAIHICCLRQ